MATSSTIIGSASMELEQAFRMMALELGEKLRLDECQKIAYVSSRMDGPAPPDCDYRLHVFSTLEARGLIGPLKLDFLEEVLERIGRKDLLSIIAKYKKKPIYKEVHSKRKLKGRTKRKKDQTMQSATTTDSTQFKDIYTCFLTQFAEIALRMRSALESDDTACMKYTFSSIANDGDAVARMLKKKLSIHAGINRDSSSTMSSGESSAPGCTSASEPPSPGYHQLESTPKDSLNPTASKESIPRSVTEPQQLARSTLPMQVSSKPSSTNNVFVFSRSASKLNLNCNSTSDDCTQSGGTGDSGFGDIKHTLSEEARQQIDPDVNRGSDQDDEYRKYREGYMPLTFPTEENHPNEYVMIKFDPPQSKNSSNE